VPVFDPATREALEARLRFYRELGLTEFYRRPAAIAEGLSGTEPGATAATESGIAEQEPAAETYQETTAIPPRKLIAQPPAPAAVVAEDRPSALQAIREEIGDCTRCALHKGRNKIVFADGDANARLMFVGEGRTRMLRGYRL